MFQWRSARRTSREKEGTWQEKVSSSAGEGRGIALHMNTLSHTLSMVSARVSFTLLLFTPWSISIPFLPHSLMLMSTLPPGPPTHVVLHPQYAVGCPVLVRWVPTSHFGLRVEQEVIRKPDDSG